ncbi:acyl-CoA dehydrogenase, partial [Paracoccus sanguinis]
ALRPPFDTGSAPGPRPAPAPQPAPEGSAFHRVITPDPVLLFRYSALTFNGHRIHYDQPYATGVEGYPGLVVHGPLLATLLMDLLRRQDLGRVTGFAFRALATITDTADFAVHGAPQPDGSVRLWARRADGALAMDATATLETS